MAIPTTVKNVMISGLPGEIAFDGPTRVITALVATADASNVFGRAFTYTDEAVESVSAGGTNEFAGILINPKAYGISSAGVALQGRSAEFLQMGEVYVQLANAGGTIGDAVYYVNATGALGSGTAGAGQTQIPNAKVVRHNVSSETPNLAVIRLTN